MSTRSFGSVRVRITVLSAMVIAIALLSASWALLRIVRADLVDSARDTLDSALESVPNDDRATARFQVEIGGRLAELGLFSRPSEGLASGVLTIDGRPEAQFLLEADTGRVLSVFTPVTAEPIEGDLLAEVESLLFQVYDPAVDGTPGALDASPILLIGATPLDDVDASIDALQRALMIVGPLLVLVVAAVSWWLTGRALRPVHAISERVEEIGASQLDQRVPVPDAHDEISELATVVNRMLDRLERGAERTSQFTADASHELRTPLSSVRGAAEIIESRRTPERAAPLAGEIVAEVDRMDALIDDLLALARLDESQGLWTERADVAALAVQVADRVESAPSGAALHVEVGPRPVEVDGDASQLRRLLVNLVDNALRHATSEVRLHVSGDDEVAAIIIVDDDGAGIEPADRDRIFDRFTRLDGSRGRSAGGAGLSLALVRSITRAHGATITVSDSPLGGARFEVRLPHSSSPFS